MTQQARYGSWKSPITSDLIVSESVGLSQPAIDGENICWIEMRPSEGGRCVIVRRDAGGASRDMNPPPFNARTRVHEYGGGDYLAREGAIYFSNFADQQIYLQSGQEVPVPVTAADGMRYADYVFDPGRNRLISVREDHTGSDSDAVNTIVSIDPVGAAPIEGKVLTSGNDFYSSPRLSPDARRLAWLTWNHPNMPWDGTELWVGKFGVDGMLSATRCVAGGLSESIFQPEWSPEGNLYFVSDRSGWWNLCRLSADGEVESVCDLPAEFGMPQWVFGMSSYAFVSPQLIVCNYIEHGRANLALLDTQSKELTRVESPYTDIQYLRASPGQVVFRGASPASSPGIVRLDLASLRFETLRHSMNVEIDEGYISQPEAVDFSTEGGLTAHGMFYAPRNRDYSAPADERPPLLVKSHGGPTSAASAAMSLTIQYLTSRGIAVLDVNYGGSTGYGRAYRERLKGQWGIVDVDDCVNGARYLIERGVVDGNRLSISGGSAGGYTTLCALTFRDVFKAGASHYGVSDVEALVKDTHKFESRYLDGMIGPYPERRDLYLARSPIHFTEQLSCPVIFFQGLEDKVVPPSQAEVMVAALRAKGLPVAYIAFAGEQHGFRQAKNIKRALDGELFFFSRVFGFDLADEVEPVEIENL
ncbi:MAG: peptidase prolyl oligopeptidase active site region [Acidobacteria bacterium]|nr:peptidase prolyl oligopeptidase active site region [Acidobacteriota bacterium]